MNPTCLFSSSIYWLLLQYNVFLKHTILKCQLILGSGSASQNRTYRHPAYHWCTLDLGARPFGRLVVRINGPKCLKRPLFMNARMCSAIAWMTKQTIRIHSVFPFRFFYDIYKIGILIWVYIQWIQILY